METSAGDNTAGAQRLTQAPTLALMALVIGLPACQFPEREGVSNTFELTPQSRRDAEVADRTPPTPKPDPTPEAPKKRDLERSVVVSGGTFQRGSDEKARKQGYDTCRQTYARPRRCKEAWFKAESPRKNISINTFSIDAYEVTNEAYGKCVDSGACAAPKWSACRLFDPASGERKVGGEVPESLKGAEHPVVCVDWHQAKAFCTWRGGRLPTEAEWEKAARGTEPRTFPWGDRWEPQRLNWGEVSGLGTVDKHTRTAPVGMFPEGASPYGAHDMAGNVWEWTLDWFDHRFYEKASEANPVNAVAAKAKVLRGGAWSFAGNGARTAFRHPGEPGLVDDGVGFRCVRVPK